MIGLNLLPDVKKEYLKAQRSRNMVVGVSIITILAALALTALLAVFVYGGQALSIRNISDQIKDNQAVLQNKPDIDKYLTVQNQLSALETLHSQKAIYSRVFDYLQKLNPAAPDSMTVTAISVDKATSVISMQGTTADFRSLDVVKSTLENAKLVYRQNDADHDKPLFTTVTLVNASLASQAGQQQSSSVSFDFQLAFSPEAFDPTASNLDVIVPKLTPSDANRITINTGGGQ
jgi:type II secretory pathway component PulL